MTGDGYKNPDHTHQAVEDRLRKKLAVAYDLLKRCYDSGHREGWEDGETTSQIFQDVNNFLSYELGEGWDQIKQEIHRDWEACE